MSAKQNPTDQQNLAQWSLYQTAPRERRMNVVSEFETIFGEAPSGAHEAEPRWVIWREVKDENGRITRDYAQDGANNLYWIYNTIAFNPVPDQSGRPYSIELDNNIVFDGMVAGLPVANITVGDVDDLSHNITVVNDPNNKFNVVGNTLLLADSVQLIDIAYPLKLRAQDDDGNTFDQVFAIYVKDPNPAPASEFIGELNLFEEDGAVASGATATILDYTIPPNRELRFRLCEVFGRNTGNYTVEIDGDLVARKETYYTRYETEFNFDNFELLEGQNLQIKVENKGPQTAYFNARVRGYQYAV